MPAPISSAALVGGRKVNRLALLEKVSELGSITAAAKAVGLSYKAAWEAVETINNLSEAPLVIRTTGGRSGGGTELTVHGRQVLEGLRQFDTRQRRFLEALGEGAREFEQFCQLFWRLGMKTSARNQFLGRITKVKKGPVNAEVILDIGGGDEIVATVTMGSVENLGLATGKEAYALFKAPWVILVRADDKIKTSARNRLCGTVSRSHKEPVNTEVVIDLPGGKQVVAIITGDSVDSLKIKVGTRLCALIKASHVIVAVQ
ncbi:MAG: TOBE domain-containing protein [Sulfuricaulis sp.]